MQLTVIGSGDAFCANGMLHSCYLLEQAAGTLMMECGPGVLAGMKRLGIPTDASDTVLISHLHGDHFAGVPFLFLEYTYANPRTRPLQIIGPRTTEDRVYTLYDELYKGMICRELPFPVEFVELEPGDVHEAAGFTVEAFEVPHNAEPYSLGFNLDSAEGRVLFSGDSSWTDEFVARSQGVDLFLCECCCIKPVVPVHTSYEEILAHRDALGCARLMLTHVAQEVRERKNLEIECAYDGLVIELAGSGSQARSLKGSRSGSS